MAEVVVAIFADIRAADMVDMDCMDSLSLTFDDINDDVLIAMGRSMQIVAVVVVVVTATVVHAPDEEMQYYGVR